MLDYASGEKKLNKKVNINEHPDSTRFAEDEWKYCMDYGRAPQGNGGSWVSELRTL